MYFGLPANSNLFSQKSTNGEKKCEKRLKWVKIVKFDAREVVLHAGVTGLNSVSGKIFCSFQSFIKIFYKFIQIL